MNDPVNYVDLWGLCGSDGNHWIDNGDGTFTALEGATLWGLYGADWQEKSGFEGDPTTLQVGDTVGKKVPRPTFQYPNSILERKEALLSSKSEQTFIDTDNTQQSSFSSWWNKPNGAVLTQDEQDIQTAIGIGEMIIGPTLGTIGTPKYLAKKNTRLKNRVSVSLNL